MNDGSIHLLSVSLFLFCFYLFSEVSNVYRMSICWLYDFNCKLKDFITSNASDSLKEFGEAHCSLTKPAASVNACRVSCSNMFFRLKTPDKSLCFAHIHTLVLEYLHTFL